MQKNQLVPPASVRDLEKGARQHKALNDERVLPILYACAMISSYPRPEILAKAERRSTFCSAQAADFELAPSSCCATFVT
jgi:hypothetical protein